MKSFPAATYFPLQMRSTNYNTGLSNPSTKLIFDGCDVAYRHARYH